MNGRGNGARATRPRSFDAISAAGLLPLSHHLDRAAPRGERSWELACGLCRFGWGPWVSHRLSMILFPDVAVAERQLEA